MNNQNAKESTWTSRIFSRPDWPLFQATFWRVLTELWLPAIGALLAMLWDSRTHSISIFDWGAGFFTKLFFFGAFFRYWQVARKLVIDEQNHHKVVGKQDQVLTRLEAVGQKLEGLATGGDGYAYVWDVQTDAKGCVNTLFAHLAGAYPLHDIQVRITTRQTLAGRFESYKKTANIASLLTSDFTHSLTILQPNTMQVIPCNIVLTPGIDTYVQLNWSARNGSWSERLYLAWIENRWRVGSRVWHQRTRADAPTEYAGPNYPTDENNIPIFPAYDGE